MSQYNAVFSVLYDSLFTRLLLKYEHNIIVQNNVSDLTVSNLKSITSLVGAVLGSILYYHINMYECVLSYRLKIGTRHLRRYIKYYIHFFH